MRGQMAVQSVHTDRCIIPACGLNSVIAKGEFMRSLRSRTSARKISTLQGGRSVSDDGVYPDFCRRASQDSRVFATFRSDDRYREILEHLSENQGYEILAQMKTDGGQFLNDESLSAVALNDRVGGPPVLSSVAGHMISPTTIRYLKIASDIERFFDLSKINSIAEIGVGYGGQIRVLDALGIGTHYALFDLPPVLDLASRYLECFVLRGSYSIQTLNTTHLLHPSLVISMYALSELPRELQMVYLTKVLRQASAGFLIMNDCWDFDRLTRDEWASKLGATILPEKPTTAEGNYVLIWGH